MEIKMTEKQFRRLLDLVYIGNWILNSTRGDDRIRQYDEVESLVFSQCLAHGMAPLTELYQGQLIPSQAFAEGGIHAVSYTHLAGGAYGSRAAGGHRAILRRPSWKEM